MDFIKIVIHRNASKRNKARLRAQPDLKNLFLGDWGKFPQRAKLYKSTLLANLGKSKYVNHGLWCFCDTGGLFFIASFMALITSFGRK